MLNEIRRVSKKKVGISLQMNDALVNQEMPVALQEVGGGEAFARVFHLRIAESEPKFLNLIGCKESVDDLDVGAQEGNVGEFFLQRLRGSCP